MNLYTKKPFGSAQGRPLGSALSKKNFSWQKTLVAVFVFFALIGILYFFGAPIKNTFYTLTSPISKKFWQAGASTSGFFDSFFNAKGLAQENSNLKEENQNLISQIALLQEMINQDQLIKLLEQNTQNDNFKTILAQTIGINGDFVLLNKGSDDGILENMPVISSQKVLFGKVFSVYKNFSKVMLVSDKNSVVDVKIQDADITKMPILGVIKGESNFSVHLDLISSDVELNLEDIIVSSGQEGIFPRGLLIGKITGNDKNDAKPFQTAKIQPFFDVMNNHDLFVITNYLEKPQ